jgi:hypothetical protein
MASWWWRFGIEKLLNPSWPPLIKVYISIHNLILLSSNHLCANSLRNASKHLVVLRWPTPPAILRPLSSLINAAYPMIASNLLGQKHFLVSGDRPGSRLRNPRPKQNI